MNITFVPLEEAHFPLLHRWLNEPHIKDWWDGDIEWTLPLIKEKYSNYANGFKLVNGIKKHIHPYIIYTDNKPIGYVQYYNFYDFPPHNDESLSELPDSLAAIDWYIGEQEHLGKGYGAQSLKLLLKTHIFPYYEACFAAPNIHNFSATRTLENSGFRIIKKIISEGVAWMVALRAPILDSGRTL